MSLPSYSVLRPEPFLCQYCASTWELSVMISGLGVVLSELVPNPGGGPGLKMFTIFSSFIFKMACTTSVSLVLGSSGMLLMTMFEALFSRSAKFIYILCAVARTISSCCFRVIRGCTF